MKKLILIMSSLVFLSGCSGVKQFTVKEFTKGVQDICNISKLKGTDSSQQIQLNNLTDAITNGIADVAVANSKTGCSAHITATSCSLSCGGSDTPKMGSK